MNLLSWLLGAGLAVRTVEVAVPRPVRVMESVLCLDCEVIFGIAREFATRTVTCPQCGSSTYYTVSRWLHGRDAVGDREHVLQRRVYPWSAYQEALRRAMAISDARKAEAPKVLVLPVVE